MVGCQPAPSCGEKINSGKLESNSNEVVILQIVLSPLEIIITSYDRNYAFCPLVQLSIGLLVIVDAISRILFTQDLLWVCAGLYFTKC